MSPTGPPRCPNCGHGTGAPNPVVFPPARPPALCPVCSGRGSVPHDFYDQLGASTSTAREQCRSCGGRGIV